MKIIDVVTISLLIVGGILWGVIGVFNYDVLGSIFGTGTSYGFVRLIYALVGFSAVYQIFFWKAEHYRWCRTVPSSAI